MICNLLVPILILGSSAVPRGAAASAPHPTRSQLYQALVAGKVLDPYRLLVHLSHTCNLRVDGQWLPVVDVQELVKGAVVPRGVNRIIILDSRLKRVREIGYTGERPLFCRDNRLYVWGDLQIGNTGPEGNVLSFTHGGRGVSVSFLESNDVPIPQTRRRGRNIQ
jgi:hypothetical protein